MPDIKTNLRVISNEYTIFEENQVLTHEQLNGAIEYLNDQQRLSRVDLDGVGIYCGLHVALMSGGLPSVIVTRGVGVTTDGDLAHVPSARTFTHYKRYDDTAPRYEKLAPGGTPLRTYELLPSTTTDVRAASLATFAATEGRSLDAYSALLLVESVDVDQDICSPTDCDSRGDTATDTLRVLLVEANAAITAGLAGALATPDGASRVLVELTPSRPLLTGILDVDGLASAYRTACDAMHTALVAALPELHARAGTFLWDANPTAPWLTKLGTLRTRFASTLIGLQYYYDFLKDLIETYNALRGELALDTVVCVPDLDAFPKHLLLGRLVPSSGTDARAGFYPSPVVRGAVNRHAHACLLARKLGTLIMSFRIPPASDTTAASGVRITPSLWGDNTLEERAIPYYYDPAHTPAPHETWRFDYAERGMSRHNLGYHAPAYGAIGEAARPLESNLGKYTFFRVEGHLERNIGEVTAVLESAIRRNNVPITLATGLIRATSVVTGEIESDVLATYNLVRAQLALQIEQAVLVARGAIRRLGASASTQRIATASWPVLETMEARATVAQEGLHAPWEEAHATREWRLAVDEVIRLTSQLNGMMSAHLTPPEGSTFRSLTGSSLPASIDELHGQMLTGGVAGTRPLFVSHLQQQPGLEHFAGAERGATLLLVYDEADRVIADFMLPCCNCEVVSEQDRNAGGARESVKGVFAKRGATHDQLLRRGAEITGERLADGLRIAPSTDVKFERATEADCTVTLEAPFPQTMDDVDMFGAAAIGFQPVVLGGAVTTKDGNLLWRPVDRTAKWLRVKLPELLGRPRIDFYSGTDEGTTVGWKVGVQHQLVYSETSARLLQNANPVVGGAAVFKRAASGGKLTMRAFWPSGFPSIGRIQTGLIHHWQGPRDFHVLLYEARYNMAGHPLAGGYFTEFVGEVTPIRVLAGTAASGTAERVFYRKLDAGTTPSHPPIQFVVHEDGFELSDATGGGFFATYRSQTQVNVAGTRIGAYTTAPVEIWELSDEVQSLQPLHEARARARLHVDRDCVTWDGPPGMLRPFIPDHDTWFWLRVGWPVPYGYSYATRAHGYGLRPEYPGIGTELIQ